MVSTILCTMRRAKHKSHWKTFREESRRRPLDTWHLSMGEDLTVNARNDWDLCKRPTLRSPRSALRSSSYKYIELIAQSSQHPKRFTDTVHTAKLNTQRSSIQSTGSCDNRDLAGCLTQYINFHSSNCIIHVHSTRLTTFVYNNLLGPYFTYTNP